MVHLYKEVQPADHFEISLPHFLSTNERQLLTLFYQPLTGPEPISLYLTLWAEGEDLHSHQMTHYYLMNVLNMPIGKIFEARIALEAIGLLRTWRKDEEDSRQFIYELIRPLDAQSFFQDPLLSMFLFSKIGEQAYRKLRRRFTRTINKESFKEVSRSFVDVYKPVHTNVPQDFIDLDHNQSSQSYPFYYEQFNFNLFMSGLSENLIPSSSITAEVKEVIAKLAFLYHLTPIDMQKVVILALDDNMHVSTERLKKACADYYKLTVSKDAPKLQKTFVPEKTPQMPAKASKEQEHQIYLETTPPIQLLRDINKGKEPLPSSVELAEDLIMKHGMPVGVVNVLLEYVMLTTDMKLPRKYVERIADHWMRKNLTTVKEAMELARTERDQYTKWKQENEGKQQAAKTSNYKQSAPRGSKEIIPEWFEKRNEKEQKEELDVNKQKEFEERRKKILEALGQSEGEVN